VNTGTALWSKSLTLHFKAPNFLGADEVNNSRAKVALCKGFEGFGVKRGLFRGAGRVQKL